ncbi:hypothetical protein [Antrihabitans cavernicola]|uniref:Uncharacterized protein n=1 Tax=Antrihabitans cavernicola TaxID=2495913 RepID=A0A5A7SJ27_9NOCA|nr:hypothetical protein [Spelaeibacter cavernicola]KAA0024737.1 hypothetical protein FOY51_02025 [Spelaeibacter cavernicola]
MATVESNRRLVRRAAGVLVSLGVAGAIAGSVTAYAESSQPHGPTSATMVPATDSAPSSSPSAPVNGFATAP